ncbi:AAA family ATPase [Sutcliffiella sp. NC1]|uniref:AAA family ATPase n=1 Tax=Sutcliffiella sp. NC1 TaxID=3004096 RepID=UPI0022DCFB82|nr:AAA family ATPase [Sutcliffiella sp. NC1]WBL16191.1 AAA family ATPase [Sutcliffiella sp. NC1]
MKPLQLTIAGLHSFREKQTIDFEALCEGGVFGIFGPTGSGKSSILDAMTLALYGKVERASNNTQGIMNHAENVLEVSFLFELENGSGAKRYKVERTFKRTDEVRVKSGISRLVEYNGTEQVVLADKASDVNQLVLSILGLTIDDFTRAVVLPQGKFAEFLSLKGADRRQMLQRLFHLEKYGDELNRKIKDELQDKTITLGEITAEQQGLGEASKEAVLEAEKAYKEIAVTVEKAEQQLSQLEQNFEEQKRKWAWQQEKEKLAGKIRVLKEQEAEISYLESNVKKAEEAKFLQPILEDLKQVKDNLRQWEKERDNVHKQLQIVKKELDDSSGMYEKIREDKSILHPQLLAKKEQLVRATQLEQRVEEWAKILDEMTTDIERKEKVLIQQQNDINKLTDTYNRAVVKQKQLKEEQQKVSIPMEKVEEVEMAYEQKQLILQKENSWKEAQTDEQEIYNKLQSIQLKNKNSEKQVDGLKDKLVQLFRKVEKYYHSSSSIEIYLDWLQDETNRRYKIGKQKVEKENLKRLAHDISRELKAGEPCLVCGSTTHEGGIVHLHEEQVENEDVANLEAMLTKIQKEKQLNATIKVKYEQLAYELHDVLKEVEVESTSFPQMEIDHKEPVSNEELHTIFQNQIIQHKGLRQDFIQLQQLKEDYISNWRSTITQQEKYVDAIKMYEEQWGKWSKRLQVLKEEIETATTEWNKKFSTYGFEQIEKIFSDIRNKQKQAQEFNNRIEKSIEFIDQKEKELQLMKEVYVQAEKEMLQADSTKKEKHSQKEQLEKELFEIVGMESASTLMNKNERQINELLQKEEESYTRWQKSQVQFHEMNNKEKQAEQMIVETSSRLQTLETKWNEQLEQSIFTKADEVEASIPFITKKDAWKQKVDEYWDNRKILEKQLKELVELIGETELREEEWISLNERLAEQKKEVRAQMEAKSAAYHSLASLQERHQRYEELEKTKAIITAEKDKLQKLQSVFKGNSFVEYLAEEQLMQISVAASERLGALTHQRYALELDSQGGFVIRDDANGGVRRPVSTLSGGETFLTSLALALSLSAQIQLRGEYPLQFFFLDEGFGTLDAELLGGVVTSLEKLQSDHLAVGVISHVAELRARLPRRLVVTRAEPSGKGSTVKLETL